MASSATVGHSTSRSLEPLTSMSLKIRRFYASRQCENAHRVLHMDCNKPVRCVKSSYAAIAQQDFGQARTEPDLPGAPANPDGPNGSDPLDVREVDRTRPLGVDSASRKSSTRIPRADTLRRICAEYSISLDWLLGLSQDEKLSAEIKPALEIAEADDSNNDTLLERWHKDAAGYKIRYVPAQIPDLLRTPDVIAYEYSGRAAPSPSWHSATLSSGSPTPGSRRPTWRSACRGSALSYWRRERVSGADSTVLPGRHSSIT